MASDTRRANAKTYPYQYEGRRGLRNRLDALLRVSDGKSFGFEQKLVPIYSPPPGLRRTAPSERRYVMGRHPGESVASYRARRAVAPDAAQDTATQEKKPKGLLSKVKRLLGVGA
jgi:hypothetical protein